MRQASEKLTGWDSTLKADKALASESPHTETNRANADQEPQHSGFAALSRGWLSRRDSLSKWALGSLSQ